MRRQPGTVRLIVDSDCDGGYEWHIEASVSPGIPGRHYGPPEDCYPDEPPEIKTFSATCPELGLSTESEAELAYFWGDDKTEDDVYDVIFEKYEDDD